MTAVASFANRSINFSTTDTRAAPTQAINNAIEGRSYAFTPTNELNLNGTISYAAGKNNLRGEVTAEKGMKGSLNGHFYGPNANEICGTFATDGAAGSYLGAFGGKR